jgi:hypothetical protein
MFQAFAVDGSYYDATSPDGTPLNASVAHYTANGQPSSDVFSFTVTVLPVFLPAPNGQVYMLESQQISRLNTNASLDISFPIVKFPSGGLRSHVVVLPDSTLLVVNAQTTTATYTHYNLNGVADYILDAGYDVLTFAGVIYDRIKNLSSNRDVLARFDLQNIYIDVRKDGQLTVLDGGAVTMKRYIPVNPAGSTVDEKPTIPYFSSGVNTHIGDPLQLGVFPQGLEPFSFQWYLNGVAIPGATSFSLTIPFVAQTDLGNYTVTVSNSAGTVTSPVLQVAAPSSAKIVAEPINQTTSTGVPAIFQVGAEGAQSFQWQAQPPGATTWSDLTDRERFFYTTVSATLYVPGDAEFNGYRFRCVVTGVTNQVISDAALLTLVDADSPPSKFANISTRSYVGTGASIEIGGFVIRGAQPKQVLIRGLGPNLKKYGVNGTLEDPVLKLYSIQTQIGTNDDWSVDPAAAAAITRVSALAHAPQLDPGSKDSAMVVTLAPGAYTAQLIGKDGGTGNGMIEIYEADEVSTDSNLINISTRSETQAGPGVQIAGFIITGNKAKSVLIRALGPTLAPSGVKGFLDDPVLTIYAGQTVIGSNDDWSSDATNMSQVEAATAPAGAVPLTRGSMDAAEVVSLAPGGYTVQVSGKNGKTGVTLIEVYEIP